MICTREKKKAEYLLFRLKDVASEGVAGPVSGNVAKNLQILRVMGHIENPRRTEGRKTVGTVCTNGGNQFCLKIGTSNKKCFLIQNYQCFKQ